MIDYERNDYQQLDGIIMSPVNTLVHQLQESDIDRRVQAAYALGESGDPDAFPVLAALLNTTEDSRIRNAAAIGLHALADNRAAPFLLAQIKNPKDPGDRGTLVYALEGLDARPALVDLVDLIGLGNFEVAAMAIHVIESFSVPVIARQKREAKRALKRYGREQPKDDWRPEMLAYTHDLLQYLSVE